MASAGRWPETTESVLQKYMTYKLHNVAERSCESLNIHLKNIKENFVEEETRIDLKLLGGAAATMKISFEVCGGDETEASQSWHSQLNLAAVPEDVLDASVGSTDTVQVLGRYLLLCLRKRGLLQKGALPVPNSEPQEVPAEDDNEDEDEDEEEEDDPMDYFQLNNLPATVDVNMGTLSMLSRDELMMEKEAFLSPNRLYAVRKMTQLHCDKDPGWAEELLRRAAPRLEELQIEAPNATQTQLLKTMPQLTRLDMQYFVGDPDAPPIFSAPPANHQGLRWLKLAHLPESTTMSVVRAHANTLRELWLGVGTWDTEPERARRPRQPDDDLWPNTCKDLHEKLARCNLRKLRYLTLFRWMWIHERSACLEQRASIREVLPEATIICYDCDYMAEEL